MLSTEWDGCIHSAQYTYQMRWCPSEGPYILIKHSHHDGGIVVKCYPPHLPPCRRYLIVDIGFYFGQIMWLTEDHLRRNGLRVGDQTSSCTKPHCRLPSISELLHWCPAPDSLYPFDGPCIVLWYHRTRWRLTSSSHKRRCLPSRSTVVSDSTQHESIIWCLLSIWLCRGDGCYTN